MRLETIKHKASVTCWCPPVPKPWSFGSPQAPFASHENWPRDLGWVCASALAPYWCEPKLFGDRDSQKNGKPLRACPPKILAEFWLPGKTGRTHVENLQHNKKKEISKKNKKYWRLHDHDNVVRNILLHYIVIIIWVCCFCFAQFRNCSRYK